MDRLQSETVTCGLLRLHVAGDIVTVSKV